MSLTHNLEVSHSAPHKQKKCWVEAWLYRINEFAEGPSQKWMEKQPPSDQQKQSSAMSTGTDEDSQSHPLGSGG